MPELIISTEAHQDLLDIWLYIAEDSTINADRFLICLPMKVIGTVIFKLLKTDLFIIYFCSLVNRLVCSYMNYEFTGKVSKKT